MSAQRAPSKSAWRNRDVDWDSWPVQTYLSENYRQLHACDDAVLVHHSAFYRQLAPASLATSLELGAGPNLYPLMLATAASRFVHAVDLSVVNVSYLREQVTRGADASWQPFYDRCRELNPDLAPSLKEAMASVWVSQGDIAHISRGGYDLASMNFVAESISEDRAEVAEMCRAFVGTVRPGGHLVAAFMENMARYDLGNQSQWPGCPIDARDVSEMFADQVDDLKVTRIDADPSLPDYYGGYTGMIMLTARRRLGGST